MLKKSHTKRGFQSCYLMFQLSGDSQTNEQEVESFHAAWKPQESQILTQSKLKSFENRAEVAAYL